MRCARTPANQPLQSLPAQSALSAALNPIDARLRRELDEYFEPFEAALEHQLSAHHRCFTELHGAFQSDADAGLASCGGGTQVCAETDAMTGECINEARSADPPLLYCQRRCTALGGSFG